MNIIEKNNLVDEAYNQLLQMIASGEWVEGSKLPSESQLCETLGVSRNTVRVALSKLNALGLIESRQGFGYSVRNLNIGIYLNSMLPTMLLHSRDLESITEFRIGVESEAAAVAAERATAEDLERMRVACEKAEAHMGDPDMFAKVRHGIPPGGGGGVQEPAVYQGGGDAGVHVHRLAHGPAAHSRYGEEPCVPLQYLPFHCQ